MNPYFVAGLLLPPVACIIMQLVVRQSHANFIAASPELRTPEDLEAFKRIAATNMYAALVVIVLQGVLWLVWITGVLTRNLPLSSIFLTMIPFLGMLAAGLASRPLETRVQTLPVADPGLAAERDRIVEIWKHQPLPNW
jgi:hypothetical protein